MANPFGLEAGSTPPSGMAKYHVIMQSVPKPHPAFKSYMGEWKPEAGLVRILGNSDRFDDDSSALSARRLYDQVKRQLVQLYGQPDEIEGVSEDGWEEEKDFCMAIENGARSHACQWNSKEHALTDNVEKIFLMVGTDDGYQTSHVVLIYDFPGFEDELTGDEYGLESL